MYTFFNFLGISFTKKENMKGDKTWNFVTSILLNEAEPNFFYHVFLMISLAFKFSTASEFLIHTLIKITILFSWSFQKLNPYNVKNCPPPPSNIKHTIRTLNWRVTLFLKYYNDIKSRNIEVGISHHSV